MSLQTTEILHKCMLHRNAANHTRVTEALPTVFVSCSSQKDREEEKEKRKKKKKEKKRGGGGGGDRGSGSMDVTSSWRLSVTE